FKYSFVDIEPILPRRRFLDECANPTDDFTGSMAVCDDELRRVPGLLQGGSVARQPTPTGTGIVDHRGERLVDFVGNRGGHLSQSRHARDVGQLRLRFSQGLFGLFALGDVAQGADQPHHGAVRVPDRFTHALHEPHRTIRTDNTTFEIIKLSLMDDLIVTLYCISPIFGMNNALDEVLARHRAARWIKSEDAEYFIGPTSMACEHIDFVAPQVGHRLCLVELSFA